MVLIKQAHGEKDYEAARTLMRAYLGWLRDAHLDILDIVEPMFAAAEAELAGLPGPYAPPRGRLLLAYVDGDPVGVVAMRDEGGRICRMQRMFVRPRYQGRGIGRALANRLIAEARAAGYERMRLDTGPRQPAAHALYRSLDFQSIPPFFELPDDWPDDLKERVLFMELAL